jgi:putative sugar O-methyltransferase
MSETIDVAATEVKDDRSGWQAEDQIAVEYLAACVEAVENDEAFANFKSNPKYKTILEHVLKEQGQCYLNICREMNEEAVDANIELFKENDKIGNPERFAYPDIKGTISPTTLRYMKNTFEMALMMDGAEISKVVEVGGGYGGLCRVLSKVCDFDEYILIDLPEVSALQRKYLDQFPDLKDKVKCIPTTDLEEITDVDLFISNYALSECDLESQMAYFQCIVQHSKYAYIIYNLVNFNDFHYNDFIDKIKEYFTFDVGRDYENTVILATRKDESN